VAAAVLRPFAWKTRRVAPRRTVRCLSMALRRGSSGRGVGLACLIASVTSEDRARGSASRHYELLRRDGNAEPAAQRKNTHGVRRTQTNMDLRWRYTHFSEGRRKSAFRPLSRSGDAYDARPRCLAAARR